jgi:hypothetical protein
LRALRRNEARIAKRVVLVVFTPRDEHVGERVAIGDRVFCEGARFRPEVLEHAIERGGRELTIANVLDLPVSEALALLSDDKRSSSWSR